MPEEGRKVPVNEDVAVLKVTAATHEREIRECERRNEETRSMVRSGLDRLEAKYDQKFEGKVDIEDHRELLGEVVAMKSMLFKMAGAALAAVVVGIVTIVVTIVLRVIGAG